MNNIFNQATLAATELVEKAELKSGDIAVILPMQSHEVLKGGDNESFMAVFGISLLKKSFTPFSTRKFKSPIYSITDSDASIKQLFLESAQLTKQNGASVELLITSNLYRICAFLCPLYAVIFPVVDNVP